MADDNFLRGLADDGEYTPEISRHSLEKIRLHNTYASIFTTSVRNKWPQLAYIGLYSGAGRAVVRGTGEIVETTALSVFRTEHPFTNYIFVDKDERCVEALRRRIAELPGEHDATVIQAEVGDAVDEVTRTMPAFSPDKGLLSFCFVDPFTAELDFEVIRALGGRFRMDFLILLMLGNDIRRNFRTYFDDPDDRRIGALIDDANWRDEWRRRDLRHGDLIRFMLEKFDAAMTRIGYRSGRPAESHPVRIPGKNVFQYSLVFYSKHDLGRRLWLAARKSLKPQQELGL